MTDHILPESTNACPTSPTTDIQPEPLREAREFFAVECEKHGFSSQAVAVRAGDISYADGGQVCIDAMLAFARHRLTHTASTLGDVEPTDAMLRAGYEKWEGGSADECKAIWCAMNAAAPASPIPTATGDMGKARLALEAIKAVTATTKDAVAGLSRIMAITQSAGVDASYSDLMAKADVALIVNRPRGEWRHLFERADGCTIPPECWTCSRTPGHDGPCAASPIPTSVGNEGERIAQIIREYCQNGVTMEPFGGHVDTADLAADAILALSPALDNTAVEELRPFREWHEDHGDALWWKLPIHESPYVGSPLDVGRSVQIEIYIGVEQHEFPMANTGGWPFDASDEASLFWSPLPDARAVTAAVAAMDAVQTEKAR